MWHGSRGGKSGKLFDQPAGNAICHHEIIQARGKGSDLGRPGKICNKPGPERDSMYIVVLLKEFCFKFGHVHIGGTFRFTTLATQTKIHYIINLLMIKPVELF